MSTPAITIDDLIGDQNLLGNWFAGPSWDRWKAVLKAAFALPMTDYDLDLFRAVADRDPPRKRVRVLEALIGRRGGKDSTASAIATLAAIDDYSALLRPGEVPVILCLACDRQQAKVVLRYIQAFFAASPLLRGMVVRETQDGLELSNGVEIIIATNDFRSIRGKTVVCAIMDEAAFYSGEGAASSDREVFNALQPAMSTVPSAMLIIITSVHKKSGLVYDLYSNHYGKDDDEILVVLGTSRAFNETLDQGFIDSALARDPEAAGAEFLSQWRDDLSQFLDRELVEAGVDRGVLARPPIVGRQYLAGCDSSGGRSDSFTFGVAHAEGSLAVLDLLYERRAPFNPSEVVAEIATLLRPYGIHRIAGDKYGANWVSEAFSKVGVQYEQSERDRSAIYLDCLPLFTSGRVRLVDNPRMVAQFSGLERRTFSTGRDRVDHGPSGQDDCSNSAALALVLASATAAPSLIRPDDLLVDGVPVPVPTRCDAVFATFAANKTGQAAVCYWASSARFGRPLDLLDFDVGVLGEQMFSDIRVRLSAFCSECRPRFGALGVYTVGVLAFQLLARGTPASAIDDIAADPDGLALALASHVSAGKIKVALPAQEKSRTHPLAAALDPRLGEIDDPLALAVLWGAAVALDERQVSVRQAA